MKQSCILLIGLLLLKLQVLGQSTSTFHIVPNLDKKNATTIILNTDTTSHTKIGAIIIDNRGTAYYYRFRNYTLSQPDSIEITSDTTDMNEINRIVDIDFINKINTYYTTAGMQFFQIIITVNGIDKVSAEINLNSFNKNKQLKAQLEKLIAIVSKYNKKVIKAK